MKNISSGHREYAVVSRTAPYTQSFSLSVGFLTRQSSPLIKEISRDSLYKQATHELESYAWKPATVDQNKQK